MNFKYIWKNNEANFGPPLEEQVEGGAHVTGEFILKKDGKYLALRRPNGIPEHELPPQAKDSPRGLLYFCHNLIRYGESLDDWVERVVKDQAGVNIKNLQVVHFESSIQKEDKNWALTPYVIVELEEIPQVSSEVTEVVEFTKENIPDDFAWWNKNELKEFLEKHD